MALGMIRTVVLAPEASVPVDGVAVSQLNDEKVTEKFVLLAPKLAREYVTPLVGTNGPPWADGNYARPTDCAGVAAHRGNGDATGIEQAVVPAARNVGRLGFGHLELKPEIAIVPERIRIGVQHVIGSFRNEQEDIGPVLEAGHAIGVLGPNPSVVDPRAAVVAILQNSATAV